MLRIIRSKYSSTLRLICNYNNVKNYQTISHNCVQPVLCTCIVNNYNLQTCRFKTKKEKRRNQIQNDDEEDEVEQLDDWENTLTDKSTKIVTVQVNSLRADLILKSGLGIARNKIETMFYESKIRVNGKKLLKKSEQVHIGDEVDVIKGLSVSNPKFLTIGRVEILSVTDKNEGLSVRLRRCRTLIVENYNEPWKPSTADI